MDQPARLDPHRREESRRNSHQLDGGRRKPEHFTAKWFYQGIAAARHGDRGGRLSIQGREQQNERPRYHLPRWAQALCGLSWPRLAAARQQVRQIIVAHVLKRAVFALMRTPPRGSCDSLM